MGGVVNAITWPQYGKKSPLRSAVPNRFQVFKPIHCFWLAWKEAIGFAVWCLVVVRPHCDLIEHVLISTLIDCVVVVAVYNPECLCQREKEVERSTHIAMTRGIVPRRTRTCQPLRKTHMIPSVIVDSVQSLLSEQLPCKKTKVHLYVHMRSLFYVINRVNEDDRVLLA
ncbi:conserved hypothetical protein [Trichinella spiralis]|uniref:hypothetical protein n=1 Tax=Trichinella spiralis TaxID=6334 RepID=UPI0001EFBBA4|nr:conserved hypothetical protein [Trichinella spiralis]